MVIGTASEGTGRTKYHRSVKASHPRSWRTRPHPFADIWHEVERWLHQAPKRTAKVIFEELQQRYPNRFPDGQLRTLRRRVREWRARAIVQFDAQWLDEDVLAGASSPPRLHASIETPESVHASGAAAYRM